MKERRRNAAICPLVHQLSSNAENIHAGSVALIVVYLFLIVTQVNLTLYVVSKTNPARRLIRMA